jgi:hypothetical protein
MYLRVGRESAISSKSRGAGRGTLTKSGRQAEPIRQIRVKRLEDDFARVSGVWESS